MIAIIQSYYYVKSYANDFQGEKLLRSRRGCVKRLILFFCFLSSAIFDIYCQAVIFPSHMINFSVFCLKKVKIRLFMR